MRTTFRPLGYLILKVGVPALIVGLPVCAIIVVLIRTKYLSTAWNKFCAIFTQATGSDLVTSAAGLSLAIGSVVLITARLVRPRTQGVPSRPVSQDHSVGERSELSQDGSGRHSAWGGELLVCPPESLTTAAIDPDMRTRVGREKLHLGYGLFLRESVRALRSTASLVPSSRFLASGMLDPLDFSCIETAVELGCGTGALTREILRRLGPRGRLISVDINRSFVQYLRRNYTDVRLRCLVCDAEDLSSLKMGLAGRPVHAVVSSLGLSLMGQDQRWRILTEVRGLLSRGGVMTQYQYLLAQFSFQKFRERQLLHCFFKTVHSRKVLLNIPPAVVFVCR